MTVLIRKIISTLSAASFVTRLAAGALCIIVFVVTLTGLSLYQSKHQYEERAIVSTQNLAQVLEQSIDDIIGKTDFALLAVKDEVKRQIDSGGINERTLNTFIARQKERLEIIDSLRITDAQGTVRYGPGVESSPKTDIADQDHFIVQRDNPNAGLVISRPVLSRISKKLVIPLSRRMDRPDGSFAGIVYANIELNAFITMFSSLNVGPNGTIALRNRDLGVIARYPEAQGVGSTIGNKAASPQLREMLQAGRNKGTWNSYSAIDNIERVFSFNKISHYPLYVVVGRAASEYLSDWRKEALKMILLSALFTAAILVSSWQMLLRQKREKQAWEELRKLNTGLEDRIVARTAEVSRSNEQLQAELTERKLIEEKLRVAFVSAQEEKAKTEAVIAALGDAINIQDTDYSILYQNQVSRDIYGDHIGENCYRAFQNRDHVCETCHLTRSFRDGVIHTQVQKRNTYKGIMHYEITSSPVKDPSGKIIAGIELIRDITERKQTEEALGKSEKLLKAIVETEPECVKLVDADMNLIYMNPAGLAMMQVDSLDQVKGQCICPMVTSDHRAAFEELTKRVFRGESGTLQFEMTGAKGRYLWLETHAVPLRNDKDEIIALLGITRDITKRKKAEEQLRSSLREKEVLLKEIHHRVKNNLQVVASMLHLQAGYIKDREARTLFEESQKRIESMALLHEKLYQAKDLARIDFREYVVDLASNLLALNTDKSERIEMKVDIEGVILDVNNSIPCGLIINELVSNALAHAFQDGGKGQITIGMHNSSDNRIRLSVSDNGAGFPEDLDFKNTASLGMQLVNSLVNQLDGLIELDRSKGTAFRIEFQA